MTLTIEATDTPEQLAKAIHAYVNEAEALLRAGEMTELKRLDSAVEALCARIMQLTTNESKAMVGELKLLRDRIDGLGQSMRAAQREITATVKSLSTNKKAASAYRKQNAEKK